jgi:multisubunit Na+/H+ antiporter MnhG subunit
LGGGGRFLKKTVAVSVGFLFFGMLITVPVMSFLLGKTATWSRRPEKEREGGEENKGRESAQLR